MRPSSKRVISPFTDNEAVWVVLEYGPLKGVTAVRRKFRGQFKKKHNIPTKITFKMFVANSRSLENQPREALWSSGFGRSSGFGKSFGRCLVLKLLELLVLGVRLGIPQKKPASDPPGSKSCKPRWRGWLEACARWMRGARYATCVSGPKSVSGDKATQSKIREIYLSAKHVYTISNDLPFHVSRY